MYGAICYVIFIRKALKGNLSLFKSSASTCRGFHESRFSFWPLEALRTSGQKRNRKCLSFVLKEGNLKTVRRYATNKPRTRGLKSTQKRAENEPVVTALSAEAKKPSQGLFPRLLTAFTLR